MEQNNFSNNKINRSRMQEMSRPYQQPSVSPDIEFTAFTGYPSSCDVGSFDTRTNGTSETRTKDFLDVDTRDSSTKKNEAEDLACTRTLRIQSVAQARIWRNRNRPRHSVTHCEVPQEFENDAYRHVTRVYEAMTDCSTALDRPRRTGDAQRDIRRTAEPRGEARESQAIRGSKGFRHISAGAFDPRDIEAAAWVVWENLLDLHKHGTELQAGVDFAVMRGEPDDLDLSIQERFRAVCELLCSFKSSCMDAMEETNDYRVRVMVRAPTITLRTKRMYQASNDCRKIQHTGVKDGRKRKIPQLSVNTEERASESGSRATSVQNQSPRLSEALAALTPQSVDFAYDDEEQEEKESNTEEDGPTV